MDQPVRVLLVEDDEDDYFLTREMLGGAGRFALDWVRDYAGGLAAVRRGGHDVYLVDHRLDGRLGIDLIREAVAAGCRAPLILLTGQADHESDVRAMQAGAADFLIKGRVDADQLERAIRYALERKRAEDALREANETLERRVAERTAELQAAHDRLADEHRRKDLFLATLSHELRNPLGPMRAALHVLRSGDAAGPAVLQAETILDRQMARLTRLVDDLLDVSRMTRGKAPLNRERFDFGRLVRDAVGDAQAAAAKARVSLTCDVPPTPVAVDGDPTRLTQAVDNLLVNAFKFTDAGGGVAVRLTAAAGTARLTVRDTGIGIRPEVLPRLFEPFAQADEARAGGRLGLGLGLAVVRGVAEQHGGTATARSDGPGRGSEFEIAVPLAAGGGSKTQPSPAPAESRAGGRRKILVVEDNRDAAESLRMLLELNGHEVVVAGTGPDGVRLGREWGPQVVLCDIGLPGLDGYGVARELRADPTTAGTVLVAVTGYGQEEDRRKSREAGFDHHLVKPADPAELERLLATVRA